MYRVPIFLPFCLLTGSFEWFSFVEVWIYHFVFKLLFAKLHSSASLLKISTYMRYVALLTWQYLIVMKCSLMSLSVIVNLPNSSIKFMWTSLLLQYTGMDMIDAWALFHPISLERAMSASVNVVRLSSSPLNLIGSKHDPAW